MPAPTPASRNANASRPGDHARIMRAMGSVFGFVLLAKIAGAAKEIVIAYTYGVSVVVDAYVFAFTLYHWLPSLWFGVLGTVLVPLVARWTRESPQALRRFDSELLGHTLWIGIAAALVAAPMVALGAARGIFGLPDGTIEVMGGIAWPMALVLGLGMPISLASIRLMARERHANTLYEGIPALVLLAVLLVSPRPGPTELVWGTTAGLVMQWAALQVSLQRADPIGLPTIGSSSPVWPVFMRGLGIILAGEFLMSAITIIDQMMAARLDPGTLSSLGYASRLVSLVLSLAITVASRSVLPVFSDRVAAGNRADAARHARQWAGALFLAGWAVVAVGWLLAPWGVALVFERGAFDASDTEAVTHLVRLGLIQIPFYASGTVLVQLLAALHQLPAIAWIAGLNLVVKLCANLALVPAHGAGGLVLANAVMYAGSASMFWWLCRPGRIA